jgi:hypothetical protein
MAQALLGAGQPLNAIKCDASIILLQGAAISQLLGAWGYEMCNRMVKIHEL